MKNWYFKLNDKEFEQITQERLVAKIEDGELSRDTLIQNDEMNIWVKASSINGLLSTLKVVDEQTKRLPVWQIISETSTFMIKNINILWKPLFLTGLLMVAMKTSLFLSEDKMIFLYMIVYCIAFVIFTITTHRIVLLGQNSVSLLGISWSKREWNFTLYTMGIYLMIIILLFLLSLLLSPSLMMLKSSGMEYFMNIIIFFLGVFFIRLSILFPAIAIEKPDISWRWAMATTQNNSWRLVAILLIIPFVVNYVTEYISDISIPLNILAGTITVLLLVFEIIALSFSFKYLTESDIVKIS